MLYCSFFLFALIFAVIASAASYNLGDKEKNSQYDVNNLKSAPPMVTVTIKKPPVTVYDPQYVTEVVYKELAAHSDIVMASSTVTSTVFTGYSNYRLIPQFSL